MVIAYNIKRMQPGCVLLQASMGSTVPSNTFQMLFPVETWQLAPDDDLHVYEVTEQQLDTLSAKTKAHHGYP